jgi:hypothetical protein
MREDTGIRPWSSGCPIKSTFLKVPKSAICVGKKDGINE